MRFLYAFLVSLCALALVAVPARAEDAGTSVSVEANVETGAGMYPKPGPRIPPPGILDARKAEVKENVQERKALYGENTAERRDLFQANQAERRLLAGSSTPAERKALFMENAAERKALFEENQGERRELLQERLRERRAFIASSTALLRAGIAEREKERIIARAEHTGLLLDAMLERLIGLAARIEGRIAELAEEGVDTTAAEAELDEAYVAIDEAEAVIGSFKAELAASFEADAPRDALASVVHPAADAAKTALRAAHTALMEAAKALPKPSAEAGADAEASVDAAP